MAQSVWGDQKTQFFFELTPERVLDAVEEAGFQCTGRCMPLNSMENRVYEVELEIDDPSQIKTPSDRFRVVKFYRPGRWTKEQILDEHEFLFDLVEDEVPVIEPLRFEDGTSLRKMKDADIWYCLYLKRGGRSPDELDANQIAQIGRLLARIHSVGSRKPGSHRLEINPDTYGIQNLEYLLSEKKIPLELEKKYETLVREICKLSEPLFKRAPIQRIHGDCHFGNILWSDRGAMFLDFDDMLRGPPVQDLWLICPGRDEISRSNFESLIQSYGGMRDFDRYTLRLVEPLRALRFIHFSAWMAKRWDDPAFPRAFPFFGTVKYWEELVHDLGEQLDLIRQIHDASG